MKKENKNHSRVFLSGISTLENNEIPDYKSRGWKSVLGFTLIELLVVVLIIGILAAVAVPQYQYAVKKSRYMQYVTVTEALYKAQVAFKLANGYYTTNPDLLGEKYYYPGMSCKFTTNKTDTESNILACGPSDGSLPKYGRWLYGGGYRACFSSTQEQEDFCKRMTGSLGGQTWGTMTIWPFLNNH